MLNNPFANYTQIAEVWADASQWDKLEVFEFFLSDVLALALPLIGVWALREFLLFSDPRGLLFGIGLALFWLILVLAPPVSRIREFVNRVRTT